MLCHSGPISACEAVDGGAGRRPAGHANSSLTPCMAKKVLFCCLAWAEPMQLLRCQSMRGLVDDVVGDTVGLLAAPHAFWAPQ